MAMRWFGSARALAAVVLLLLAGATAPSRAAQAGKVAVVAFGLFGDQAVFRREATGAARIVAARFGAAGGVVVRANGKTGGPATIAGLAQTLGSVAKGLDPDTGILFLILTSHGSPEGLAVKAGARGETLTPPALAAVLERTGIRHKVVVVSACFSGVFIPALANPDTLVITAADAQHPSFGCEDEATWTYFGDAFFNVALRRAPTIRQAFDQAKVIVRARELQQHFEPSNPQIAGGENTEPLLAARP